MAAGTLWLSRWQACRSSGLSVEAYRRQEGFDARAAYRWKRALRRMGQWTMDVAVVTPAAKPARPKRKGVMRFARVAVQDVAVPAPSMLLRLTLGNGRRAELEVSGAARFDTSPIQLAVFLKLAHLAKHVVWVGDVKQAIYGFRGDDAE